MSTWILVLAGILGFVAIVGTAAALVMYEAWCQEIHGVWDDEDGQS